MMKRKPIQAYVTAWLLLIVLAGKAQTSYKFTAKECADYAAKNNVQVKNALIDFLIQKETNRDVTSAALPQITGTGNVTDYLKIATTLIPGEFIGQPAGTFIPVKFGTNYITSGGLNLSQTLFDGQVFIGLQARKKTLEYSQKNVEVTEENIRANIYKIYYQLAVSKTQIELLDANISRLEKLQHDTREIYKNGFAEKLDVDKLSVQLTNLGTEKLQAVNQIEQGFLGLKLLMGMPMKDTLELTEQITDDKIKAVNLADSSYKYTDRKDYQYLGLVKELNEYNIRRYKLSKIPTLKFNFSTSETAQRENFDFLNKGDWFPSTYFSFALNVPIFNGFSTNAKINTAKLTLRQTQNNIEYLQNSIDVDVAKARLSFKSAVASMDYQKQNMQLAEDVYNQTKKKYEVGTGSSTEINAAETDLKQAQTNYTNAMYDAIIAKIDYVKAIGKLE